MIFLSFLVLPYLSRKYPDSEPLGIVVWFVVAVVTGAYEGVL